MDYKKVQHLLFKLLVFMLVSIAAKNVLADEGQVADTDEQLFASAVKLSSQQQWAQAESIYRDLLKRNKDWPEPKNNLAVILLKTDRLDEAKEMLEQAVISSPSFRIAHQNRTQLYNYLATLAYDKALGSHQQKPAPEMEFIQVIHQPVKTVEKIIEKKVEVLIEKPVSAEAKAAVSAEQEIPLLDGNRRQLTSNLIEQALLSWSQAWTQGDFEHYVAAYSSQFVPSDNRKSFVEWKNIRRGRLKFTRGLNVTIEKLRVFLEPGEAFALVEFIQDYQSTSYSDKVLKQMYMQNEQGNWLILSERIIKTY